MIGKEELKCSIYGNNVLPKRGIIHTLKEKLNSTINKIIYGDLLHLPRQIREILLYVNRLDDLPLKFEMANLINIIEFPDEINKTINKYVSSIVEIGFTEDVKTREKKDKWLLLIQSEHFRMDIIVFNSKLKTIKYLYNQISIHNKINYRGQFYKTINNYHKSPQKISYQTANIKNIKNFNNLWLFLRDNDHLKKIGYTIDHFFGTQKILYEIHESATKKSYFSTKRKTFYYKSNSKTNTLNYSCLYTVINPQKYTNEIIDLLAIEMKIDIGDIKQAIKKMINDHIKNIDFIVIINLLSPKQKQRYQVLHTHVIFITMTNSEIGISISDIIFVNKNSLLFDLITEYDYVQELYELLRDINYDAKYTRVK